MAIADVDGDGLDDIITVPSYGQAEVKVFRKRAGGRGAHVRCVASLQGFSRVPVVVYRRRGGGRGRHGSTVAGRNVRPRLLDGKAEIVVGSSAGMKTTVKVFDVSRMTHAHVPQTVATAVASFTPFSTAAFNYFGGVSLSVARISASLTPDIVVGAGVDGHSRVDVWAWNTSSATLSSLSANGMGFAAFTVRVEPRRLR